MPPNASLHFQNWYVTRLREAVDAVATTIYVDNPPAIGSGILVLEGKNASKREIIYFSSVSGYALNDCVRGLEGTTPNTHNQGAAIEQAVTAGQLDQVLSPHILLQGLGNDENAAMSQDAVTRVITKSHNPDGTIKQGIITGGEDGMIGEKEVTAHNIDGGSTAGALTTDNNGVVSAGVMQYGHGSVSSSSTTRTFTPESSGLLRVSARSRRNSASSADLVLTINLSGATNATNGSSTGNGSTDAFTQTETLATVTAGTPVTITITASGGSLANGYYNFLVLPGATKWLS